MIGLTRKEVNHYLYDEDLNPLVWQDTDYRWYPVQDNSVVKERGTFDLTKEEALHKYFGYPSFRGCQGDIIDDILDGKDVLAIMPTGSGKSLCFQIPSLITTGTVIVISPLIALIKIKLIACAKEVLKRQQLTVARLQKRMRLLSNNIKLGKSGYCISLQKDYNMILMTILTLLI